MKCFLLHLLSLLSSSETLSRVLKSSFRVIIKSRFGTNKEFVIILRICSEEFQQRICDYLRNSRFAVNIGGMIFKGVCCSPEMTYYWKLLESKIENLFKTKFIFNIRNGIWVHVIIYLEPVG